MKYCGVIAEYNPLHNGHLRQIKYIKEQLKAEKIIVIMSGNFTQRGEPAILNKFERARQAIKAGASAVIELPTVFAVNNAETFSYGAVKILNSLNIIDGICFGVESGTKEDYYNLAKAMNNESKDFKKVLREYLDKGFSLAKSKFEAVKSMGEKFDETLISSPNNILGLEYTKSLLKIDSSIPIFPLIRCGDHNDGKIKKGITSAKSIRLALQDGKIRKVKGCLPFYSYVKLKKAIKFDKLILSKLILTNEKELEKTPDCTEGLENRLKALIKDNLDLKTFIKKVVTKRYTESRIMRILTCNLLGITRDFVADCINSSLYAKVLAIDGKDKDILSILSQNSAYPILTRKSDINNLNRTALKCFKLDILANDIYNLMTENKTNEHFVEKV